jgi:hypothetical protein
MRVETERLTIRDYTQDDAAFAYDLYRRRETHRYLGSAPWISSNQASPAIERWRRVSEANPLLGIWVIALREPAKPVGTLMLKMAPLSSNQSPAPLWVDREVGWHLIPTTGATDTRRRLPLPPCTALSRQVWQRSSRSSIRTITGPSGSPKGSAWWMKEPPLLQRRGDFLSSFQTKFAESTGKRSDASQFAAEV